MVLDSISVLGFMVYSLRPPHYLADVDMTVFVSPFTRTCTSRGSHRTLTPHYQAALAEWSEAHHLHVSCEVQVRGKEKIAPFRSFLAGLERRIRFSDWSCESPASNLVRLSTPIR